MRPRRKVGCTWELLDGIEGDRTINSVTLMSNRRSLKASLKRRATRLAGYCETGSPVGDDIVCPGIASVGCAVVGVDVGAGAVTFALLPRTNCLKSAPASHGFGLQPSELSQCAEKPIVDVPSLFDAFVI